MGKWRATLPKEKPAEGEAVIVLSILRSTGERVEFSGKVDESAAAVMFAKAIEKPLKLNLTPNSEASDGKAVRSSGG